MSPRKYLKHLGLLAGLSLFGVAAGAPGARADEAACDAQLIVVHGAGATHVRPDSLRVDIGVEVRAATLDQAREQAGRTARKVIDAVRATAIANLTLDTKVIQVNPIYGPHRADQPPVIIGFAASNHVVVTLREAPVDELGDRGARVIDAAMTAGANSIGGLEFFLADPSAAQDEALTAAVSDAQHDAEVIARAGGVTLGGLRSVETSTVGRIVPRSITLEAGVSTPIEVEDIVVQSNVTAKFAFE
jgi:uncharacterized protein YggE